MPTTRTLAALRRAELRQQQPPVPAGRAGAAPDPREHALLETLLLKQGQTVSKQALSEALFTLDDNVSPDAVEIYVHRVRKKLQGSDVAIITLRGLGYLLKAQAP
jgi:two-component system response regulator TctD